MKLHEIKLFEEPIQTRPAQEVWDEGEGDSSQYISNTVYHVRPLKDDEEKYEVTYDEQGKRKTYATMSEEDFEAAFSPARPNQKPDAEGYTQYRAADVFSAFKYTGDPIKIALETDEAGEPAGQTIKLNSGDYLLRQDDGKDFVYTVERADYFDNGYTQKK